MGGGVNRRSEPGGCSAVTRTPTEFETHREGCTKDRSLKEHRVVAQDVDGNF